MTGEPSRPSVWPITVAFRDAAGDDLATLLVLARRYCEADGHPFDPARAGPAFAGLIDRPDRGRVLLAYTLDPVTTGTGSSVIGYAVVTWGYSIESGGVEALLDEIYVEHQGRGLGSRLLDEVVAAARAQGAHRLFLETETANQRARDLYLRRGFTADDSIWLSRPL
jgi:ribosomal protein S18 acetylase RimI-like enzyme